LASLYNGKVYVHIVQRHLAEHARYVSCCS
jgi:hypothetical protein